MSNSTTAASAKPGRKLSSKPKRKAGKPRARLTSQQEAFAQHYAVHRNASEAYCTAYPGSRKWKQEAVHQQASKLLKKPNVTPRVEELQARVKAVAEQRFDITAARVLRERASPLLTPPTTSCGAASADRCIGAAGPWWTRPATSSCGRCRLRPLSHHPA